MHLVNLLFILFLAMNIDQPQPEESPLFTFGIFADAQYADAANAGNRYYSSSALKLKEAYETFGKEKTEFVINLGDLIDKDFASFTPVLEIIEAAEITTYHVTGNHDYSVSREQKDNLPVIHRKKPYYSFSRDGFRFIFLDGNEISTYTAANEADEAASRQLLANMKSSGMKNAMDWNGAMSERQLKWLRSQVTRANTRNEKVIISCHFPIFPDDAHNLLNYKEVLSLLDDYDNIVAWFAGHNHAGSYDRYKKIHCLTFRGMVETSSTSSFAIVDVYKNRLQVRGSGREENRLLAY